MLDNEANLDQPITAMGPLSLDELRGMRLHWRAANYLAIGQIFLRDNALMRDPLTKEHLKDEIFSCWGTIPGINLVYTHLNRLIKQQGLQMMLIAGPGHGCAALIANAYLDGTYSRLYPQFQQNLEGIEKLFSSFGYQTFANDVPGIPGTIQAGYELGYSLAHAFGAVLDNKDLIVCCIVGDGEAETGTLSASWQLPSYLNPATDGAVLPVVHLNQYKVAARSSLSTLSNERLSALFTGLGYQPYLVEGVDPEMVHMQLARAMDQAAADIRAIKTAAYTKQDTIRPEWPIILLKTPKGWTGPKLISGEPFEGSATALKLQRLFNGDADGYVKLLERWLHSYTIKSIFQRSGQLQPEPAAWIPEEHMTLSASTHANGGSLRHELKLPPLEDYKDQVEVADSSKVNERLLSVAFYLRDVIALNGLDFRLFSSDGNNTARFLAPIFSVTQRVSLTDDLDSEPVEEGPARVVEILSQSVCQTLLEGYILSGRHGIYVCSEQHSNLVVSMLGHYAHWLSRATATAWRKDVSSFNYLQISTLWSPEQARSLCVPGFVSAATAQSYGVTNLFFPADGGSLLAVMESCLKATNCINSIVVDPLSQESWLTIEQSREHAAAGLSIWHWAGTETRLKHPDLDLLLCCIGAVPTRETLQAVQILTGILPHLSIRVVNVVCLNKLQQPDLHPAGLEHDLYDEIFPSRVPAVFAYHGYSSEIYTVMGKRVQGRKLTVKGYQGRYAEGSLQNNLSANEIDRFHLALAAIDLLDQGRGKFEDARNSIKSLMTKQFQ
ncbi:MAG: phosphoketolase family protein [Cyanobacteria bacterium SZAS LIN-3]|nr:phosphoketolase family protein [Cyanobacteria bacterium SZAS LIN-3]MBS2011074.1 phosphoketolase family protein [Cyanobacteria bacterium SZAS TMP-1]